MRLYDDLAPWWPLLSRPEDYEEEAGLLAEALRRAGVPEGGALLELGAGGGNLASRLRTRFTPTLTDLSSPMLTVSRHLNPALEHVQGDMRTLRLGRTFDAVLIHDAVAYLTTQADLDAAFLTARAHLSPGGVLLAVPDAVRETWRPASGHGGHDEDGRSLRYLEWSYDDDPRDTVITVQYALLLREHGREPQVVHEAHRLGLFPRATWLARIEAAGFRAWREPYPHSSFSDGPRDLFLGRVGAP